MKLPSEEEINTQIEIYSFRVPYDGSNNFYDDVAMKHYKKGIDWVIGRIKQLNTKEDEPQNLCDNFEPSKNTSSSTVCAHCGREKWLHQSKKQRL